MTYHELLQLYKKGALDKTEMESIRRDIEKQDAISEYLYLETSLLDETSPQKDRQESEGPKPPVREAAEDPEGKFIQMIQRSIRRAFIRMGAAVGIILLAILLFTQTALPGIVSLFYYDPGSPVIAGSQSNRMSLDMAVYTELCVPGYHRDNVSVRDNGFGDYEIVIHQNVSLNQIFTNITGRIRRNHLILYNNNILSPPPSNMFEWYSRQWDPGLPLSEQITEAWSEEEDGSFISRLSGAGGSPENAAEHLKQLSSSGMYLAYVTLDREMDYEEFIPFTEALDMTCVWCAPRTSETGADNLGFYILPSSSSAVDWDEEAYPALQVWKSGPSDSNYEETREKMRSEEYALTHFTSMLRYLSEQKRFCQMMEEAGCPISLENLRSAAEYVQEHGLRIYGFSLAADKETLLKLNENDQIYVIATEPLQ